MIRFLLFFLIIITPTYSQINKVYLFGEVHQNNKSENQSCYQRMLKLIQLAKEETIHLGLEGIVPGDQLRLQNYNNDLPADYRFSDKSKNLFALEDPSIYGFAHFYGFYFQLIMAYDQMFGNLSKSMSSGIASFFHISTYMENLVGSFISANPDYAETNQLLDDIYKKTQSPEEISDESMGFIFDLLALINREIIDQFNKLELAAPLNIQDVSQSVLAGIRYESDEDKENYDNFLYQYIALPRENIFVDKVLEKTKEVKGDKPIAILIGHAHVERVYQALVQEGTFEVVKTLPLNLDDLDATCSQSLGFW